MFHRVVNKTHNTCVHFESFITFAVHHSSSVTFFPLTLDFFHSGVIKSSLLSIVGQIVKLEGRACAAQAELFGIFFSLP